MKNFSHSINVNNNSNYIINHTECDWSAMRKNSLISIGNDMHFYTIGHVEPLNVICDFSVLGNDVVLNDNLEENFIIGDTVTISYKEYELFGITSIINKGQGYKIGDILSPDNGIVSNNIFDNTMYYTNLKVADIDGDGGILKLDIQDNGRYIEPPQNSSSLSGGNGSNAQIFLSYRVINNRKMVDKQVISCKYNNGITSVELDSSLPSGVKDGKLSMRKFKGWLTSNYIGQTQRDIKYHVVRDATPFLGMPFLSKNSNKNEEFYNHTILQLDHKLKDLQRQIDELKKN